MTTKTEKLNTLKDIMDDQTIATDLLLSSKSGVRSLAVAITETATPEIKKLLKRELETAIDLHDKIAQYMIEKEMYHAYDIKEQVSQDLKNAKEAMKIGKEQRD
jgi:similar to spore coat protein